MTHSIFDGRWPHSRTPTTTPRVHSLPAASSPRIHHPPPVKLRARSVHAKVAPLRAIDLECFQKPVLVSGSHPHVCSYCGGSVPLARVCCDGVISRVQPAQPTAAPATPHVWAAGQWAMCTQKAFYHITPERAYEALGVYRSMLRVTNDLGEQSWYDAYAFIPATAPAPAGEREWRVGVRPGDRFFCRDYCGKLNGTTRTVEAIVDHQESDGSYGVRFANTHGTWGVHPSKPYMGIEPAPAVESERGR
jgi:hypothetical protein